MGKNVSVTGKWLEVLTEEISCRNNLFYFGYTFFVFFRMLKKLRIY